MANKTITQLDSAQSLNDNMVIAVQDTNATYKTTLADVKAYCVGGSGGDAYAVGDRVTDDSDNPVGTVSSIFTDGNGDRYAVVCLDAVNRLAGGAWCSERSVVTNLPLYQSGTTWWYDDAKETATSNTQLILDYCTAGGYTSTACTHCHSKSFTIDGITYYGQLPNMRELFDLWTNRVDIESKDSTATSNPTLSLTAAVSSGGWSSTQYAVGTAWLINSEGGATGADKVGNRFVIPVLEIPL